MICASLKLLRSMRPPQAVADSIKIGKRPRAEVAVSETFAALLNPRIIKELPNSRLLNLDLGGNQGDSTRRFIQQSRDFMSKRYLGMSASSEVVTVVEAEIPDDISVPIIILGDSTWKLQKGDRAAAYAVLHQQCVDHIRENKIEGVVIKASAVPQGAARLNLLVSAEVRGVVMAAAASVCSNTTDITAELLPVRWTRG